MEGIVVDTSSILFALSNKVDIFGRIREELGMDPIISKGVVRELTKISKGRKANGKYAVVALKLIERHKVKTEPDSGYVDMWVLTAARKAGYACTNDTALRRKIRAEGIKAYSVSRNGGLR